MLVGLDYPVGERTQMMAEMIYLWPKRLEDILDEANSKHFDQKVEIEDRLLKEKREQEQREKELKEKEEREKNALIVRRDSF